jgi:DNA-binding response OmpR family regulator
MVLLCDADRVHADALAEGLVDLGYSVEMTHTHAEAFALACAFDFAALVTAPFLHDGSALVLPTALGLRRPPALILVSWMRDRLAPAVAARAGYDAQLVKVVDPRAVDRVIRTAVFRRRASTR